MDLDYLNYPYLSSYLIQNYIENSNDSSIYSVLNFYKSYRAFVRGKVHGFQLNDPHIDSGQKNNLLQTAKKYFGDDYPIGKQVYSDVFQRDFTVLGVIKELPENSTFKFNVAASIDLMPQQRMESWELSGWTYILLRNNISKSEFNEKFNSTYLNLIKELKSRFKYTEIIYQIIIIDV
jgi:hypothetical protein